MGELRKDLLTGRWVIVATDAPLGPDDFDREARSQSQGVCPFCPGNEAMTPPEIARRVKEGHPWTIRVVPNKFPALRIEGELDRAGLGIYDRMNGLGAHEVIIETPDHQRELSDASAEELLELLKVFQERSNDLKKDKRFRYLLIFKNFGEAAGASLAHPHCQLIALPIVPKRVKEEMRTAQTYYAHKERCLFCDVLYQELTDRQRVVWESDEAVSFAPYASCFPFEVWIIPKVHQPHFALAPVPTLAGVANALVEALRKIRRVLHNPSYNFILHTSTLEDKDPQGYHWHMEIMPRLTRVAGFEWGSGFYINPTPPELACRYLK